MLLAPNVTECPRCGATASHLELAIRWAKIFVVAVFLVTVVVAAPATFFIWLIVDRAGYVMTWWQYLLLDAAFIGLCALVVTMVRSKHRHELTDVRHSMEMPAVKPPADSAAK